MQPIERYGVAALLFLIVTVGAVVLWDQSEANTARKATEVASASIAKTNLNQNLLASLDKGEANAKKQEHKSSPKRDGRINLGTVGKNQKVEPGRGGRQAGATNFMNSDDWSRGTKADLRIPLDNGKAKKMQAERALAVLADTEKDLAPKVVPAPKKIGSGALLNVSDKRQGGGTAVQPTPKIQTYKVAPGDTLGQIAVDQLGGYSKLGELLKANPGLSVDSSLTVGKSLSIPDIGQAHTRPSVAHAIYTKPESVSAKAGRTYTVKEGDNLWGIAASQLGEGARNSEIRAANPQMKSNALSVGMVLTLPDGSVSKGTIAANVGKRSEHGATTKQPRFKPGVVR